MPHKEWRRYHISIGLKLSRGQGQNQATEWKYCTSVVWHTFYGSFGKQNSMVAFIFKFGPRKGQYQVKWVKFAKSKFSLKMSLFCPVLNKDFKTTTVICFHVWQLEVPKIAFQNVTSSPLPIFTIASQQNILFSNFACVFSACSFITFIKFFY